LDSCSLNEASSISAKFSSSNGSLSKAIPNPLYVIKFRDYTGKILVLLLVNEKDDAILESNALRDSVHAKILLREY
jgi:hypothetical protein